MAATRTALRAIRRAAFSTTASGSQWKPALAPGVQPAYDEALAYLSSHSSKLRSTIDSLGADQQELRESLSIAASINDPAVLASFQSGNYDANQPVFRHLRQKTWRQYGALDKLMQRCTLMHVLPDVILEITPIVDLQVAFGEGQGVGDHGGEGGDVLAGVFVDPSMSLQSPKVSATAFHMDERKYTLLMVDPDVPYEHNQQYRTVVHHLVTDVPLSATSPFDTARGKTIVDYVPPHPQKGTPYHRYTTLLLQQTADAPNTSEINKEDFNVNAFVQANALSPAGIHFWRAKWTADNAETVSKIYADILQTEEPKYGRPPKMEKIRKEIGVVGSKWFD